jgi:hypothetical protein
LIKSIRAACADCAFTGLSRNQLSLLLSEIQPAWAVAREERLRARRGRERIRTPAAGRRPRLSFTDRVVITLVHLRLAIPHAALAVTYDVDQATVTRAVTQIRPLPARRGYATAAGTRLHTLTDVFAYAAAEGVTLRLDATEIRVRRPRHGRPGRKAFVSGKLRQNTIKTTIAVGRCARRGRSSLRSWTSLSWRCGRRRRGFAAWPPAASHRSALVTDSRCRRVLTPTPRTAP